jgi:hypothetical protein
MIVESISHYLFSTAALIANNDCTFPVVARLICGVGLRFWNRLLQSRVLVWPKVGFEYVLSRAIYVVEDGETCSPSQSETRALPFLLSRGNSTCAKIETSCATFQVRSHFTLLSKTNVPSRVHGTATVYLARSYPNYYLIP